MIQVLVRAFPLPPFSATIKPILSHLVSHSCPSWSWGQLLLPVLHFLSVLCWALLPYLELQSPPNLLASNREASTHLSAFRVRCSQSRQWQWHFGGICISVASGIWHRASIQWTLAASIHHAGHSPAWHCINGLVTQLHQVYQMTYGHPHPLRSLRWTLFHASTAR